MAMGADTDIRFKVNNQADPGAPAQFLATETNYVPKARNIAMEEEKKGEDDPDA